MGFEILWTVSINITVFWDETMSSSLYRCRRFGETCLPNRMALHL
jgi:hypothetical protein